MSAADMKDWPLVLRRNAALCAIAAVLFKARGEVYGGNQELADAPPHVRDRFIAIADEALTKTVPSDRLFQDFAHLTRAHFATGLRTPASNVVGFIGLDDVLDPRD